VKRALKNRQARGRAARPFRLLKWIAVAGVLALAVYGISRMSNIAYTEKDIGVVDFSALSAKGRRTALEAANRVRCTCGCGMTLAQCVATDSTCPLRERNIGRIEVMVEEAKGPRPVS